jgi:membrane-bound lytic murein transglycosylase B
MGGHRARREIVITARSRLTVCALAGALVLGLLAPRSLRAAGADAEAAADGRGWGYVVRKLIEDGKPRAQIVPVFADRRMPPFTGLSFSLHPSESRALYRRLLSRGSVAEARRCRTRNASAFEAAERTQGVPASVIAAILHVESSCGRNAGSSPTLYALARLAMAGEPENLAANIERHAGSDAERDPAIVAQVQARARYLEETFYPEVRALFDVAERMGVEPLALRGSSAGAFGYPQFLPTSYLQDGVDADGDGRVSLDDFEDAAASCARFLVHHGWRSGMSTTERRAVLWQYNRSSSYIDTVLTLARSIEGRAAPSRVGPKRARRHGHAPAT